MFSFGCFVNENGRVRPSVRYYDNAFCICTVAHLVLDFLLSLSDVEIWVRQKMSAMFPLLRSARDCCAVWLTHKLHIGSRCEVSMHA